ncbi:hypothetical protein [Devosia sp. Root635]|uniref:hypothetical protein n=1 Tax=Devosia sp. Root635 TaxID=1736575 RepID=UPI0007287FE6|nr:hypothetical protein [Devosia sp. Root635]KRA42060.1 hypothetical protein ASD80_10055 [Devosia sp. Root635]
MNSAARPLLIAAFLLALAGPAHAEPLTLFFTGIGLGITGGGATLAGVSLATGAMGAGIAVGAFLPRSLLGKLMRKATPK